MQSAPRPNVTSHDINSAVDSLGAPPTGAAVPQTKAKYFGKTKSVHGMMGGGQLADVLLWRKWHISAAILGVAGVMWLLFEWSGYTLLTLLANTALIIVAAVFVWAQAAHFLNRSPPPLPELQLTEEHVQWAATTMRREVNNALATAHSVAMGRDYRQVFKILFGLYIIATVGSWFNTLSLIFLSVLLLFTVPVFYEKYEEHVDAHLQKGLDELHRLWIMAEDKLKQLLHKIPRNEVKDKKVQ